MGAILVLTPIVISSWPAISAAVMGAAASMGFAASGASAEHAPKKSKKCTTETEIENSEIFAESMSRGEKIVLSKDDLVIEIGQDARGSCTVRVTGDRKERELKKVGEEVAGRIVQQFAYHKLMTELKKRNYHIVQENVMQDESIQVRVRL